MKTNGIGVALNRTVSKIGFGLKKHSPEILIVTGVVGVVTSAVLACKATTKLGAITEKAKKDISVINHCAEHPETVAEPYTEQDKKKDLVTVYATTGLKVAKLYAPSVALGAASIACILSSNNILRKRSVALAAAYTTIDNSYRNYRKKVVDRFGEELDKELAYGIKAKEVEEKVVDENGEEKVVKKTVNVIDSNTQPGDYSFFFDNGCKGWEKDAEHNKWFLLRQQAWCNDVLQAKGYLFLNDVLELLGIPKTKSGQAVGWVYDPKNPDHKGDNYVDFGIFNVHREENRDFVNGYEKTILLNFNVDGNILYAFGK